MKISLRARLTITYALLALLLVGALSLCVNGLFNAQFTGYVVSQQKLKVQSILDLTKNQYGKKGGQWNTAAVEAVGMSALSQGMILKVRDASGGPVWDATVHNNGMCATMLRQMAANMQHQYPNFKGGYTQKHYPLTDGARVIGTAEIGYYGPFYYTESDLAFLNRVNAALAAVGVAALALALLLGGLMSARIAKPISRVTRAAEEISKGHYGQRIASGTNTREILQLTSTVNELARSLELQETLRSQMSADVAHELRTPLASLQSTLEAMIDGVWAPNAERLAGCHAEILRISRLVVDLERLARAEADNAVLNFTQFDLSALAKEVIQNFEPDFIKKDVSIGFSGKSCSVLADRDKISQVLLNLISNALKYTQTGGRVQVEAMQKASGTELAVRDSGAGIAPEELDKIFERFYRADKSRNRLTGGSGLGLAIAKAIVTAHGGELRVSSEPGKGSVFTVLLPKNTDF